MVALCGNCHASVAKLDREAQYAIKKKPCNIQTGSAHGALEYTKKNLVFKVGGNWYEDTPVILQHKTKPIVSCRIEDGQALVSISAYDAQGRLVFEVVDNEIAFRVDDLWDFEYAHNFVVARSGQRDILTEIDFRGAVSVIRGKFWLGGIQVLLGPERTNLPGMMFSGNRIKNGRVGIHVN
jgi:hypothetical protein